nr:unnamed protein product [Leishmania braziliensis]
MRPSRDAGQSGGEASTRSSMEGAPEPPRQRPSIASPAVPQRTPQATSVSPPAVRCTEPGAGYYGAWLARGVIAMAPRANRPPATAGTTATASVSSARQPPPGYPSTFGHHAQNPGRQRPAPPLSQQQTLSHRREASPQSKCELQYRQLEIGPLDTARRPCSPVSTASPAFAGASSVSRGRCSFPRPTRGTDRVLSEEGPRGFPFVTQPMPVDPPQQQTGRGESGGVAAGVATATTTHGALPRSLAGDQTFSPPSSAVAVLLSDEELPSAACTEKRPQQQRPQIPLTVGVCSLGAGSPSSPHRMLGTPLPPRNGHSARLENRGYGPGSYTTRGNSRASGSLTVGAAYTDVEGGGSDSDTTTSRRRSSSGATESGIDDRTSAYYGGTLSCRDAEAASPIPEINRGATVDDGAAGLRSLVAGDARQRYQGSPTWLDQFGAIIWRDTLERRRRWFSVVLEIVIPLVCAACVVVLWAAFGATSSPNSSSPTNIGDSGYSFSSGRYLSVLCYNETWFGKPNYIDGLVSCSNLDTSTPSSVTCDTVGEEELPVKGLCYAQRGSALGAFVSGMRNGLAQVMPLDDIIAYQWLAKKLPLVDSAAMSLLVGAGLASNTQQSAILSSGKLYFAPCRNVPRDILAYLFRDSKLLQYVYNDTFDTVEAAHRVIKSGERGPTWALVNVRQLDENGFDVSIELDATALPPLAVMIDKAYPGGASDDRSDVYYTSGYTSLMDVLVKYYLTSPYAAGATRAEVDGIQALQGSQATQPQAAAADAADGVLAMRELPDAVPAAPESVGDGVQSFASAAEPWGPPLTLVSQCASSIQETSATLRAKANLTIYLGGMPWVPFKTSQLLAYANTIVGFVIVLAFLYPVSQLTRRLVLEKERRVREATLIMGLPLEHLWCSWFLHSAALMFTISFLMTLLLCTTLLVKSDAFCVFLVVFLFSLTCVPLSGLLAAFFDASRVAALVTPLIYFAMSLLPFAMRSAGPATYLGFSILSPACFALILQDTLARENGDGLAASIFLGGADNPNTATLFGFLILDFAVYLMMMFYLDAVLPKAVGVSKHPLYFILDPIQHCRRKRWEAAWQAAQRQCQAASAAGSSEQQAAPPPPTPMRRSYESAEEAYGGSCGWRCRGHGATDNDRDKDVHGGGEDGCDPDGVYEMEAFAPEQLSVRIVGLRKYFQRGGRRFVAVRNFCWQLPNVGVSVLLGHNGAGKSTVMNMMTGMLYPDGGDCYIGDHSVRFDLARARHEIGLCPQHNILWPELTCREHLEFFARLKGLRGAALEKAVVDTLTEVDLLTRQNDLSSALSGGMRRKLSVAIAFVGGSSLVFLDEPTAGMDVVARRHTWELLLRMSRSRSVLLITHFMDEADLLGDRVAIMSRGQLKCSGSSLFLKSRLGLGYNIFISVDALLRVRELDAFLQGYVPQAERLSTSGGEVNYRLPAQQVDLFPGLLSALDTVGPLIGIRGYAISPTTLEEIFLTIARDAAAEDKGRRARVKMEACRASGSAVAMAANQGWLSGLWDRLCCCWCCGGSGGRGASGRFAPDESDKGDDGVDSDNREWSVLDNVDSPYSRDSVSGVTEEWTQCSALDRAVVPMQCQSGCSATTSEENQRYPSPTATGYVGSNNGEDAGTSGNCTPAGSASRFSRPAKSLVSKASSPVSQGDVHCSGEAAQATPTYARAVNAEDGRYSVLRVPAAAVTSPVAATESGTAPSTMTAVKRDASADVIWSCEIAFSIVTISLLQAEAMMRKRFHIMRRDRRMLCFQVICPVVCVLLAMLLSLTRAYTVDELTMNTSNYPYDTLWDTTGCANYFDSSSNATAASIAPNQRIRDVKAVNLSDFYYFLQDDWYLHGQIGKYSGIACGDPVTAMLPSISRNPVVLLTNYSTYHEFPISMVNFYNLLFKGVRGPSVFITAHVATLPSKSAPVSEDSIRLLLTGIIIMVPFTFLPSNYVAWVVKERECRSRHLQDICGLRYLIYWLSNFLFDLTVYTVTMLLIILIFAAFQRNEFVGGDAAGATFTLFSAYGFCSIATAYLVQFCFATHSSAQSVVMAIGFVSGFLLVIIVFVLQLFSSTREASHKIRRVFRIFPTYAVGEGIVNLATLPQFHLSDPSLTAFSMEVIGWPCVYMAVEGPLFLILVLLIDHPRWRLKWLLRHYDPNGDAATLARAHQPGRQDDVGGRENDSVEEDSDVEDERVEVRRRMAAYRADLMQQERMCRMGDCFEPAFCERASVNTAEGPYGGFQSFSAKPPLIDAVAVVGLHKRYEGGRVAVQDLTFGVVPGEVFGLLGTNGAGKTTTMSVLCQEAYPTAGHVYVCGYNIVEERRDALQCIGYCPQFNATLDLLTVEEHLKVFAGIRGIIREQQQQVVQALLNLTGLHEYRHTTSATLSGGNHRKLSVALSLIGGPPVVVFDEPSAGMDPVARREMWTSIEAIKHRCSVILCTHHLEEVEALADCVAIMVDGRLRCIGNKVHLKQKYGSGFELTVRIQPPSVAEAAALEAIKARVIPFITSSFPSSKLSEVRGKRLIFTLPKNTSLANVFQRLQAHRTELCISDYTVSQTSIEQVFLHISDAVAEEESACAALSERRRDAESDLRL